MRPYRRNCPTWQLPAALSRRMAAGMSNPPSTPRATKRPAGLTVPTHWTNPPVPEPRAAEPRPDPDGLDPTRFGDWERNGIAIDF
jgi:hypothetical protein